MGVPGMRDRSVTIASIISPAMRELMRRVEAAAHFLLLLRPGTTKLDFIAAGDPQDLDPLLLDRYQKVMDQAFEAKFRKIIRQRKSGLASLNNPRVLFDLCGEIVAASQKGLGDAVINEEFLPAVAGRWLEENPLLLGDLPESTARASDRWRSQPAGRAQLRFQDALDWCAGYGYSLDAARSENYDRYREYTELMSETVLKVPHSASRPNLVTADNLKVILAEHLLAYSTFTKSFAKDSGLTFFFQPLKGLGQYRAAIDWVTVENSGGVPSHQTESRLNKEASPLQQRALELLFTQSLLRYFATSLQQALSYWEAGNEESSDNLRRVFADLWWANEVSFFKDGQFRNRLVRSEGERDLTWITKADGKISNISNLKFRIYNGQYRDFLATSGKRHPDLTHIRLNLSALIDPRKTDNILHQLLKSASICQRDLASAVADLPFDEVVFACYFVQPAAEDFSVWVDQLASSILWNLIEQIKHRRRIVESRAEALEGAAHWINSLMRVSGRDEAVKQLDRVISALPGDEPPGAELRSRLIKVRRLLILQVLPESGAGVFRLIGTLRSENYDKLRNWFTQTSKEQWKRPEAFDQYLRSITHLARAIGSALGRPHLIIEANGKQTCYKDDCVLDTYELQFPPLSKAETDMEAVLALLPALTEPLTNAILYLEKIEQRAKHYAGEASKPRPIKLRIEDARPSHILVKIGNPYFGTNEAPSLPGVSITRRLMSFTKLADIDDKVEINEDHDGRYLWVSVRLHPQMLAELIGHIQPNWPNGPKELLNSYDQTEKAETADSR
jgi:hypothetical protein